MTSKSAVVIVVWCLFASGLLLGRAGGPNLAPQGRAGQNQPPEPAPKEMVAPDIPGVIRGGTKVVLLRDGFNGTEGVISMPDGSVLFTEQDANKLIKVDKNDNISTYL
jgi:hypothetical protein